MSWIIILLVIIVTAAFGAIIIAIIKLAVLLRRLGRKIREVLEDYFSKFVSLAAE